MADSANEDEYREPSELTAYKPGSYEAIRAAIEADQAKWGPRGRRRPVAGPAIEIDGNGQAAESTQDKEASYLDWLRALRDDSRVTGIGMVATITALGSRSQAKTGAVTFSVGKMAEDWGIDHKSIRKALKRLEQLGYVRRYRHAKGRPDTFQLTLPTAAKDDVSAEESQSLAA